VRDSFARDDHGLADPFAKMDEDPATLAMKERAEYFLSQRAGAESVWGSDDSASFDQTAASAIKTPKEYASILKVSHKAHSPDLKETIEEMIAAAPEKGDGTLYRQIREALEVSESEVQQRTKISLEYIRAIERNAFERLPALVYVRGFLKSYLQYLGVMDSKTLIDAFSERFVAWQKTRNAN
jgi:hypothetical protein